MFAKNGTALVSAIVVGVKTVEDVALEGPYDIAPGGPLGRGRESGI